MQKLLIGSLLVTAMVPAAAQRGGGRGNPLAAYLKVDTAVVALSSSAIRKVVRSIAGFGK